MENLRGAAFMTCSMLCFAVADVVIKLASSDIPSGQIVVTLSAGASIMFLAWFRLTGRRAYSPYFWSPRVLWRTVFDMLGSVLFITALVHLGVTVLSAIIQATPLVVALGGVLFLGQQVGWRRWTAIFIGFIGVMLILRPGVSGLSVGMVIGVLAMLCLAGRDLMTRALDVPISGPHVALHAFVGMTIAGVALCVFQGTAPVWPTAKEAGLLAIAMGATILAFLTIVEGTRTGDAAFISTFRYSRMVFALILGMGVLGERPDALTLIGVTIVIAAGVFTFLREARDRKPSQA